MEVSDAKRLRALEDENRKLKQLVADQALDNLVLKDLLKKSSDAQGPQTGRGKGHHGPWAEPAASV